MEFSKEYYNIYRSKYSHITMINKFRDILLKPNKNIDIYYDNRK